MKTASYTCMLLRPLNPTELPVVSQHDGEGAECASAVERSRVFRLREPRVLTFAQPLQKIPMPASTSTVSSYEGVFGDKLGKIIVTLHELVQGGARRFQQHFISRNLHRGLLPHVVAHQNSTARDSANALATRITRREQAVELQHPEFLLDDDMGGKSEISERCRHTIFVNTHGARMMRDRVALEHPSGIQKPDIEETQQGVQRRSESPGERNILLASEGAGDVAIREESQNDVRETPVILSRWQELRWLRMGTRAAGSILHTIDGVVVGVGIGEAPRLSAVQWGKADKINWSLILSVSICVLLTIAGWWLSYRLL